jgi:hypothetical protein
MNDELSRAIIHGAVQYGVGVTAGSLIDYATSVLVPYPAQALSSTAQCLEQIIVVLLEASVVGLFAAGAVSYLASINIMFSDPSEGVVLFGAIWIPMTQLVGRTMKILSYINNTISNDFPSVMEDKVYRQPRQQVLKNPTGRRGASRTVGNHLNEA